MGMWLCPNCTAKIHIPPGTYTKKCPACREIFELPQSPGKRESVDRLVMCAMDALEDGNWDKVRAFCMSIKRLDRGSPDGYLLELMARLEKRDFTELENSGILFLCKKEYLAFAEYGDEDTVRYVTEIGKRNLREQKKLLVWFRYNVAMKKYKEATTPWQLREAAERFGQVYEFRDSAFLRKCCIEKAERMEAGFGRKILKLFLPYGA